MLLSFSSPHQPHLPKSFTVQTLKSNPLERPSRNSHLKAYPERGWKMPRDITDRLSNQRFFCLMTKYWCDGAHHKDMFFFLRGEEEGEDLSPSQHPTITKVAPSPPSISLTLPKLVCPHQDFSGPQIMQAPYMEEDTPKAMTEFTEPQPPNTKAFCASLS